MQGRVFTLLNEAALWQARPHLKVGLGLAVSRSPSFRLEVQPRNFRLQRPGATGATLFSTMLDSDHFMSAVKASPDTLLTCLLRKMKVT